MKSIMHSKADGTCYLCIKLHNDIDRRFYLHEHHVVFGNANRQLSEKYGLKVYLCPEHHEWSDEAVHRNKAIRQQLCQDAQVMFERKYPNLDFKAIFGMNYIEKTEALSKINDSCGFRLVERRELDEQSYFDW